METADLDDLWTDLKTGFEQIFAKEDISKQRLMQLYTNVYNYCMSVTVDPIVLEEMSVAQFVGGQLYIRIDLFLNGQVKKILDKASDIGMEDILEYYVAQWISFQSNCKKLNQACSFLNKHWIVREYDEGRINIRDIYELSMTKWCKVVYEALHSKVTTAALNLIEKSRNGVNVDLGQVKIAINSYVELGQSIKSKPEQNLTLYREAFEAQFLEDTERYFVAQSEGILNSEKDFVEILTVAEERLDEERRRARTYLHESTLESLRLCGEKVLLKGHEKFRARSFAE